jgi:integrase
MLTERALKALRAAPPGKRVILWDAAVPGFGVRSTDAGSHSFVLVARFPSNPDNPTPRTLGAVGAIDLADARQKARDWLSMIKKGVDPVVAEERKRQAELRKQQHTFAAVAEEFIAKHVSQLRTGESIARDLRREFVSAWGERPISDISRHDVLRIVQATVDRGAPHQARNLLAHIRKLFGWAISRGTYAIEHSPCWLLKPSDIVGKPAIRQRILNDAEWRAFWVATGALGSPWDALFRTLALTGARRDEIASARWYEIDFDKKLLVLAPERMKADAAHVVPLSDTAVEILKGLPRLGEFVFTTSGRRPVSGFSKAKRSVDELMLKELRRGSEPEKIKLAEWRIHDLRRSMRTGLSALGVVDRVAELAIGHKVQGLHKVYDQHSFLPERRAALEKWERHLLGIVKPQPAPANVVPIRAGT